MRISRADLIAFVGVVLVLAVAFGLPWLFTRGFLA